LVWDSSISNVTKLPVIATKLWIPDLFIVNTVDQAGFLPITSMNRAWVYPDGTVYLTVALNGK
jgi:hypothetical protein